MTTKAFMLLQRKCVFMQLLMQHKNIRNIADTRKWQQFEKRQSIKVSISFSLVDYCTHRHMIDEFSEFYFMHTKSKQKFAGHQELNFIYLIIYFWIWLIIYSDALLMAEVSLSFQAADPNSVISAPGVIKHRPIESHTLAGFIFKYLTLALSVKT